CSRTMAVAIFVWSPTAFMMSLRAAIGFDWAATAVTPATNTAATSMGRNIEFSSDGDGWPPPTVILLFQRLSRDGMSHVCVIQYLLNKGIRCCPRLRILALRRRSRLTRGFEPGQECQQRLIERGSLSRRE